jgi:hypothetical protein
MSNEEVMNREIRKFEVLERQSDIRERLYSCVLVRWANRKKAEAIKRWREKANDEARIESDELEARGDGRL